jgi:hypothetical protein
MNYKVTIEFKSKPIDVELLEDMIKSDLKDLAENDDFYDKDIKSIKVKVEDVTKGIPMESQDAQELNNEFGATE